MKSIIETLRLILFAFTANHEMAALKRRAKLADINTDTDAEFRAVNGLEAM